MTGTVNTGSSTTTCEDGTFGGGPEVHWSMNFDAQGYVTYPEAGICFVNFPNDQYLESFDCALDYPTTIQVCFRAFEDDGAVCIVNASCLEEVCQNFTVPSPGSDVTYAIATTGGDSEGSASFTFSTSGSFISSPDDICSAFNLGTLPSSGSLGNDGLSNYNNICATNSGDPNPWGGENDAGVWFSFNTGIDPSSTVSLSATSDPQMLGDDLNIQLAVYESSNGACSGTLTLVDEAGDDANNNTSLQLTCLNANTTYFLLVDGEAGFPAGLEVGRFGVEINDDGIQDPMDGCETLPVELLSLESFNLTDMVAISWTTSIEINNDFFILEKSNDGENYKLLIEVGGAGNSERELAYKYMDENPSDGITYYRLTQIDFDGTREVLGIIRNEFDLDSKSIIYPTVADTKINVVIQATESGFVEIEILDSSGIIQVRQTDELKQGQNFLDLKMTTLKKGNYIVILKYQGQIDTHRVVKR
ncbi:T9SS type A sorting domain-containing protein [Ekhidna sp.]